MILELLGRAGVLFPEPSPLDRIMAARGTDVVGNQVVVGDDVALMGMIPQPADILDELATGVDQGIVNGNDAVMAVAGFRVVLQPGQTAIVERCRIPGGLDEPAIEAGLICGGGGLAIDSAYVFALCHDQIGEVLSKMAPGGFVVKDIAEKLQGLIHNRWKVHSP